MAAFCNAMEPELADAFWLGLSWTFSATVLDPSCLRPVINRGASEAPVICTERSDSMVSEAVPLKPLPATMSKVDCL